MTRSIRKKAQRTKPTLAKQTKLARVTPPKGLASIGQVLTSQELAKDPDPDTQNQVGLTTDEDEQSEEEIHWSVTEEISLETLHDAVRLYGRQGGNRIFEGFLEKFPERWGLTCGGPTEEFTNFPEKKSWEEICQEVMDLAQSPSALEYYMHKIFNKNFDDEMKELDEDSVEEIWMHRSLFIALAMSDPSGVFQLSKSSSVGNARYWDSSEWYNPKLITEDKPLATVWMIASQTLGHPWTGPEPPAIEEVYWARQAKLQKRISDRAHNRYKPLEEIEATAVNETEIPTHSPSKTTNSEDGTQRSTDESSPETVEVQVLGDVSVDGSSDSPAARSLLQSFNKAKQWNQKSNEAASHNDSDTEMESHESSQGSEGELDEIEHSANSHNTDPTLQSAKKVRIRVPSPSNSDQMDDDTSSQEETNSESQKHSSPDRSLQDNSSVANDSTSPSPNAAARTYVEAAATVSTERRLPQGQRYNPLLRAAQPAAGSQVAQQNPRRLTTRNDRIMAHIQTRMDGVPRNHVQVFDVNMGVPWTSKAEEGIRLDQKLTDQVKEHAKELFEEFEDLIILPLQEKKCSDKTKWLDTYRKFAKAIKKYNDLRLYCDFNYANASYIQNQSAKPGNKVMRTRIRFAFNLPIDSMRAGISMTLANSGVNGGCFRSATQFGNQVVAGTLFFLPEQIDRNAIEHQFMMKLNGEKAVGIGEGFVNNPGQRTQKWEGFSLRQWLLYCDLPDVLFIDTFSSNWLAPTTPKQDGIYASPITYMSDWRTAKKGFLNVPSFGYLQRSIEDLMAKAKTFQLTTRVIECEADFPGLLVKAKTTNFGEISLLTLLFAIKVIPNPESNSNNAATQSQSKDGEETEEEEDDDKKPAATDKSSEWHSSSKSKKKANKKKAEQKDHTQIWNSQEKMEKVLQKDRASENSFPLFNQIFPRSGHKCSFTVREKSFQLGSQVLQHPIPFIIWALSEPTKALENQVLRKWVPMSDVQYVRDRSLVWSPTESITRPEGLENEGFDHGLGFLDELDNDPLDALNCEVQIDLEMASVRDIDDGATVVGAMQDLRELREHELFLQEENLRQAAEIAQLRSQLNANGGASSANG